MQRVTRLERRNPSAAAQSSADKEAAAVSDGAGEQSHAVQVYNLFPEDTHTYFVGLSGMLVHSCVGMNMDLLPSAHVADRLSSGDGPASQHRLRKAVSPSTTAASLLVIDAFAPALGLAPLYQAPRPDGLLQVGNLACLEIGEWAEVVGEWGPDAVVLLDTAQRKLHVLRKSGLQHVLATEEEGSRGAVVCVPERLLIESIALRACDSNAIPFAAVIEQDDVYVSYFAENAVEHYRLGSGGGTASAVQPQLWAVEATLGQGEGVGALAVCGRDRRALCVTHAAMTCADDNCLQISYGPATIFVFALDATGDIAGLTARLSPTLRNPHSLVRHRPSGALYVLYAGAPRGQQSGYQRVLELSDGSFSLGNHVTVMAGADISYGFTISDALLAFIPYSHDHLFVVEASSGRLHSVQRFDGAVFSAQHYEPEDTLPTRRAASLHDVRLWEDTLYILDGQHSSLITAHVDVDGLVSVAGVEKLAGLTFPMRLVPIRGL